MSELNTTRKFSRLVREHPSASLSVAIILALLSWFVLWILESGGTGFTVKHYSVTHARSLWDWLELLLIPVILALGGLAFNIFRNRIAQQNLRADRDIAHGREQERSLRGYIDKIQELIMSTAGKLDSDPAITQLVRVQTLVTLKDADARRVKQILRFVSEISATHTGDAEDSDEFSLETGRTSDTDAGDSGQVESELLITLQGADFEDVDWRGVELPGRNLASAQLTRGNLRGSYLSGTDLTESSLTDVNFRDAILVEADMTGAEIDRANFEDAVLEDSVMRGATLVEVNFKNAELSGVDFTGAIGLTPDQLNKASNLIGVVLPDESKIPDSDQKNPPRYKVHFKSDNWSFSERITSKIDRFIFRRQ